MLVPRVPHVSATSATVPHLRYKVVCENMAKLNKNRQFSDVTESSKDVTVSSKEISEIR